MRIHEAPDEPAPGASIGAIAAGVAIVLALPVLTTMSTAIWQPTYVVRAPTVSTSTTGITYSQYNGLYTGMTVTQARAMLGSPGTRVSSWSVGRSNLETYAWYSGDVTVMVTFENGRLFQKAQTGL